jgi:oxygen-dependent protoporphyrinogen oxidase
MSERRIAIIGGGISGLAVAEAITRLSSGEGVPIRVVVLEAEETAGGKIKSSREDGFVLDTGPHGFLDKEPKVFELIDRLGLRGSLVRADARSAKRFIVRKGRLRKVPESPPSFLLSDVLPLGAKLRVLMEPWARARSSGVEESVFEFASRRIGQHAAEHLVDAMVTGIYGGDPRQLSLTSAFPRMEELETKYGGLIRAQLAIQKEKKQGGVPTSAAGAPTGTLWSFKDGLGELTRALAQRIEVKSRFVAEKITREGDRFRVASVVENIDADAVVLAVPAYEARALLRDLAPDDAQLIGEIPYAPVAVVVQGYEKQALDASLDGFGFLAPEIEKRRVLGAIWASSVFPDHVPQGMVMLRIMLGGARHKELLEAGDQEISAIVKSEIAGLMDTNARAKPVFERIVRWPRAIPQYNLGHAARVAAARRIESAIPGIFITGNAFLGVAMTACIAEAEHVARLTLGRVGQKLAPGRQSVAG